MRHRDIRNDQIIPNGRIEPESNIEDSLEQPQKQHVQRLNHAYSEG